RMPCAGALRLKPPLRLWPNPWGHRGTRSRGTVEDGERASLKGEMNNSGARSQARTQARTQATTQARTPDRTLACPQDLLADDGCLPEQQGAGYASALEGHTDTRGHAPSEPSNRRRQPPTGPVLAPLGLHPKVGHILGIQLPTHSGLCPPGANYRHRA